MKKIFFVLIVLAVVQIAPLTAQEDPPAGQGYYYFNAPIDRVYPYRKGYVVKYRKTASQDVGTLYLPREWFVTAAGRGELIFLAPGPKWPYVSVFYNEGKFSHIRLYLRQDRGHETWGNIPQNVNLDEFFDNVSEEDFRLEF
ncbi:MAG: hypothetical protein LBH51_07480 [Treponema sp.]|nr:hypothetical protein [Treponema sp.]